VPGADVWYLLLTKLWQDADNELICKLLCCSKAMAALVRYACKGSISVVIRPYMCAYGKIDGNPKYWKYDVDWFGQWMCRNGSIVKALELHPDFMKTAWEASTKGRRRDHIQKEEWETDIPKLAAGLGAAPYLQKLVLGSVMKKSTLEQLVLALPRASHLTECSSFHTEHIGSSVHPQEAASLPGDTACALQDPVSGSEQLTQSVLF
jgi:hypothetical protein